MSTGRRENSAARPSPALVFLLVNLFGFPLASAVVDLPQHLLSIAVAPVWLILAPGIGAGIALIALNFWLCWKAGNAGEPAGMVAGMIAWSVLCIATFFLTATYSPLNLAIAYAGL